METPPRLLLDGRDHGQEPGDPRGQHPEGSPDPTLPQGGWEHANPTRSQAERQVGPGNCLPPAGEASGETEFKVSLSQREKGSWLCLEQPLPVEGIFCP